MNNKFRFHIENTHWRRGICKKHPQLSCLIEPDTEEGGFIWNIVNEVRGGQYFHAWAASISQAKTAANQWLSSWEKR